MGIRPSMQTLVGLTDFQGKRDPRLTISHKEFQERLWEIPIDVNQISDPYVRQHFLNEQNQPHMCGDLMEYRKSCIGWVLDKLPYSADSLYLLAKMDKRFYKPGFWIMESVSLADDISDGALWLKLYQDVLKNPAEAKAKPRFDECWTQLKKYARKVNQKKRAVRWNQNYAMGYDLYFPMYVQVAQALFDFLGIKTHRKEMKLFLMWDWS